jgi:alkaline phosphatase
VKTASTTKKLTDIDNAIETIFNKRSHTGWTTGVHTGEDVPVYAFGPVPIKSSLQDKLIILTMRKLFLSYLLKEKNNI